MCPAGCMCLLYVLLDGELNTGSLRWSQPCVIPVCCLPRDRIFHWVPRRTPSHLQVFAMEIENKKLTRALVREVGEEVPLAKVGASGVVVGGAFSVDCNV